MSRFDRIVARLHELVRHSDEVVLLAIVVDVKTQERSIVGNTFSQAEAIELFRECRQRLIDGQRLQGGPQ